MPIMNYIFLFHLFRPWEWTEGQSSNVINFFAATGTVGALVYAFILERKNSKKINDLANIVSQLTESNQILREQAVLEKQKMKPFAKPEIRLCNSKENRQELTRDTSLKILLINRWVMSDSFLMCLQRSLKA